MAEMTILKAILLGLVQGLTEFIPVSSSGHLVLMHAWLGINEQALVFDVALHLGTLLALLVIFYKDIWQLVLGLFGKNNLRRLAIFLICATVPAVISGVLLESAAESSFRSVRLVSLNLIVFGIIMLIADKYAERIADKRNLDNMTGKQAVFVGVAQAVAVIPGVSRSGSTITAGIFAGLDRVAATRFSFLLAIPITAGAIMKVVLSSNGASQISSESFYFGIGIATAFVSGMFAIRFMLRYLSSRNLSIFAYYRLALGLFVIAISVLR